MGSTGVGTTTMPQSKSSPEPGVPGSSGGAGGVTGSTGVTGASVEVLVICGVTKLKLRSSPAMVTLSRVTAPVTPGAMSRSPETVMLDRAAPPAALIRRLPSTLLE